MGTSSHGGARLEATKSVFKTSSHFAAQVSREPLGGTTRGFHMSTSVLCAVVLLFSSVFQNSAALSAPRDTTGECIDRNWDSLDVPCVQTFFAAFSDPRYQQDVEWSEGANELLFKLMDRKPQLFFSALFGMSARDIAAVKKEIDNPINDGIPIRSIVDHVKQAKMPNALKRRSLALLKDTIEKERQSIESYERANGKKWVYPPWP